MTDKEDRKAGGFRDPYDAVRCLPNLADTTRGGLEVWGKDRLDRIDDNHTGSYVLDALKNPVHGRLTQNEEIGGLHPQPFGSHLGLFGRLLPRDVKDL